MCICEKSKSIDNIIEQNKSQYGLKRQTAKISALLSGNVSKYEFLIGKDVLPETDLLEKATLLKKDLKIHHEVVSWKSKLVFQKNSTKVLISFLSLIKKKNQWQLKKKNCYDSKYSFRDNKNVRKYYILSFTTKYDNLNLFHCRLN